LVGEQGEGLFGGNDVDGEDAEFATIQPEPTT
jgi:hypothetical protein